MSNRMLDLITLIQGGQTGVDRGAWAAAREYGVRRDGWMPAEQNDELGVIPALVRQDLRQHGYTGYPPRTRENIKMASGVLVIVPDRARARSTPGTRSTIDGAHMRSVPVHIVDSDTAPQITGIIEWMGFQKPIDATSFTLMVAGPRGSKWIDSEKMGFQVLCNLFARLRKA